MLAYVEERLYNYAIQNRDGMVPCYEAWKEKRD